MLGVSVTCCTTYELFASVQFEHYAYAPDIAAAFPDATIWVHEVVSDGPRNNPFNWLLRDAVMDALRRLGPKRVSMHALTDTRPRSCSYAQCVAGTSSIFAVPPHTCTP